MIKEEVEGTACPGKHDRRLPELRPIDGGEIGFEDADEAEEEPERHVEQQAEPEALPCRPNAAAGSRLYQKVLR